jgi:N-methylhydantoinase A
MKYVIGTDVGGTHTDCVISDGHGIRVSKVRTSPDATDGVIEAIENIANGYGISLEALLGNCDRFVYGSTTATNIFVTHRVAKIGLLCTKGHRDSLWFRDGYKADRWNMRYGPLWQLLPRYLRRPVEERLNYKGEVLTPLNEADVRQAAQFFKSEGVEAIAISFLWSFLNPSHEQRSKEILREELPETTIVTSYEALPLIREWERTFCTCLSAGILAEVSTHLLRFRERLKELGFKREPLIMQCNGGHATIEIILRAPLALVASGPAAGGLAGVFYGEIDDSKDMMTIDTGGTSCDVCVLPDGKLPITKSTRLQLEPIAIPSVEVHTIGAGGGSIAWIDPGGALRVGPNSAGARPGPTCYGEGGEEPTVTDAYLVLGYLNPDFFLGGRVKLYPELAEKEIQEKIAKPLGLDASGAAADIVEIMNSHMSAAMRLLSVERGIDPRPFTLVVGGGAGPIQATSLAKALGMRRVVVPRQPGGFCALGMVRADLMHNELRTYATSAASADLDKLSMMYKEQEASLVEMLESEGIPRERIELRRFIDARYAGQVYELETDTPMVEKLKSEHLTEIVKRFEDIHERVYHYRMDGFPVEFVGCRVEAIGKVPPIMLAELPFDGSDPSRALKGKRGVCQPGSSEFVDLNIYDGEKLEYGNVIDGAGIIETEGSTVCIWKNERLVVNKYGDFEIEVGL